MPCMQIAPPQRFLPRSLLQEKGLSVCMHLPPERNNLPVNIDDKFDHFIEWLPAESLNGRMIQRCSRYDNQRFHGSQDTPFHRLMQWYPRKQKQRGPMDHAVDVCTIFLLTNRPDTQQKRGSGLWALGGHHPIAYCPLPIPLSASLLHQHHLLHFHC